MKIIIIILVYIYKINFDFMKKIKLNSLIQRTINTFMFLIIYTL